MNFNKPYAHNSVSAREGGEYGSGIPAEGDGSGVRSDVRAPSFGSVKVVLGMLSRE